MSDHQQMNDQSVQQWLDETNPHKRRSFLPIRTTPSPIKGQRLNGQTYGREKLTLGQWSDRLGYNPGTIRWDFYRWGNLDRLDQNYHQQRAKKHWGKTRREWYEYIVNNLADGQKMPTIGSVGNMVGRGKREFHRYVAKKLGHWVAKRKRSAEHTRNQSRSQSSLWQTPRGAFLGGRLAAQMNGISQYQFRHRLNQDPKNWYRMAKNGNKCPG